MSDYSFFTLRSAIERLPQESREWGKAALLVHSKDYIDFVTSATQKDENDIVRASLDFASDSAFRQDFGPKLVELESLTNAGDLRFHSLTLYLFIRLLKPEFVIETGVAHGKSSAAILLGLHHNQVGQLLSLDVVPDGNLPDGSTTSMSGRETGWLVPEFLRNRWNLVIEDSVGYLRRAKREGLIGQVDFFFHDSLHTFEHLSSELDEISSIMSNSGLIVADNMEMESGRALEDFGRRTHRKVHRFGNLGFLA